MTWDTQRAAGIIETYKHLDGPALPVLRALQLEFGDTFYHDFRREPGGRTDLKICRAEACQAMGGDALGDEARKRLGVDWHGTTKDGEVTLEPMFCLGLCSVAPAAQVGDRLVARADWPKIEEALRKCRR
jgi:formate dehydrogenase subunit gamma